MRNHAHSLPTVVLVHGSWHDGSCWSAVQECLDESGLRSVAPTLAGHERGAARNVTHDDYVASVLEALDREEAPAALVGHSFGGSVISRVAEVRPERCHSLVYYPGQSSRLEAPLLVGIDGDHEALFTAPDRLAAAIVGAVEAASETNGRPR